MRIDAFSLIMGAIIVMAAAFAGLQALSAPPSAPSLAGPELERDRPDANALTETLQRLEPAQASAPVEILREAEPTRRVRLIGVMQTDQGRIALLEEGARSFALREGETHQGIEVIAIDQSLAVLDIDGERRRISLGAPQ